MSKCNSKSRKVSCIQLAVIGMCLICQAASAQQATQAQMLQKSQVSTQESLRPSEQAVNPFTGRALSEEGLRRELAVLQVQTAISAETLKQRQLESEIKLTGARSTVEERKLSIDSKALTLVANTNDRIAPPVNTRTPVGNNRPQGAARPPDLPQIAPVFASPPPAPIVPIARSVMTIGGEEVAAASGFTGVATLVDSQVARSTKPPSVLPVSAGPSASDRPVEGTPRPNIPITLLPNPSR